MIAQITSTANQKYRYIKSLQQKKYRTQYNAFTVEGIKSVRDAVNSGWNVLLFAVSETFYREIEFAYEQSPVFILSDTIFGGLCDTKTPQGILAVLDKPERNAVGEHMRRMVYCDNVADPGNLGTIIRSADASGMDGVLLSPGCADLYSPKTVRASMGSFFHVPVYTDIMIEQLECLRRMGKRLVCGALRGETVDYTDCDLTDDVILAVGNEANGICAEVLEIADTYIKIPIVGRAESLNAAVAASLMMYESLRQRTKDTEQA